MYLQYNDLSHKYPPLDSVHAYMESHRLLVQSYRRKSIHGPDTLVHTGCYLEINLELRNAKKNSDSQSNKLGSCISKGKVLDIFGMCGSRAYENYGKIGSFTRKICIKY